MYYVEDRDTIQQLKEQKTETQYWKFSTTIDERRMELCFVTKNKTQQIISATECYIKSQQCSTVARRLKKD